MANEGRILASTWNDPMVVLERQNSSDSEKSGSFASFGSEIAPKETKVDITVLGRNKRSTRVKRAVSSYLAFHGI